jgi:hypothetical protein
VIVDLKEDIEKLLENIVGMLKSQKEEKMREEEEQQQQHQDDVRRQQLQPSHHPPPLPDGPSLHSADLCAANAIAQTLGLMTAFGDDADAYWHSVVLPQFVQVRPKTSPPSTSQTSAASSPTSRFGSCTTSLRPRCLQPSKTAPQTPARCRF